MTRRLTIELPEEVADRAEAEAARSNRPLDDVVRLALVEHFGWRAVADVRDRNTDLNDVLSRPKFANRITWGQRSALLALLHDEAAIAADTSSSQARTVDPDDDYLAALALSTGATHLVTGDHGLAQRDAPDTVVR